MEPVMYPLLSIIFLCIGWFLGQKFERSYQKDLRQFTFHGLWWVQVTSPVVEEAHAVIDLNGRLFSLCGHELPYKPDKFHRLVSNEEAMQKVLARCANCRAIVQRFNWN